MSRRTLRSSNAKRVATPVEEVDTEPEEELAPRASKRRRVVAPPEDSDNERNDSPGWGAIDKALLQVYPSGRPDAHFGAVIPWTLGGPDPIRGIFAVPAGEDPVKEPAHWHYITFGFSELYEKTSANREVSGYGFELTFRLKRTPEDIAEELKIIKKNKGNRYQNDVAPLVPIWPINFLNNLARYVFETGRVFSSCDHMHLNGPIFTGSNSSIVAVLFAPDATLPAKIDSVNGSVEFLQVVGLTNDEYKLTWEWSTSGIVQFIKQQSPALVTDIFRSSILQDQKASYAIRERIDCEGSKQGVIFSSVEFTWTGPGKVEVADDGEPDKRWPKAKKAGKKGAPKKTAPKTNGTAKTNGPAEFKIKVGAAMIEQLVTVLRYRLPYRRELTIVGHADDIVTFTPADGLEEPNNRSSTGGSPPAKNPLPKVTKPSPGTRHRDVVECSVSVDTAEKARQRLSIVLSNDKVIELCELLQPQKGTYTIAGESDKSSRIVFEISPTQILSATGDEIVDIVGDKNEAEENPVEDDDDVSMDSEEESEEPAPKRKAAARGAKAKANASTQKQTAAKKRKR